MGISFDVREIPVKNTFPKFFTLSVVLCLENGRVNFLLPKKGGGADACGTQGQTYSVAASPNLSRETRKSYPQNACSILGIL